MNPPGLCHPLAVSLTPRRVVVPILFLVMFPAAGFAQTQCWGTPDPNGNDAQICFPSGAASFADVVLRYQPNFSGCGGVDVGQTVSSNSLGPPQWSWQNGSCSASGQSVSLGNGGLLEVGFLDNRLSNSGSPVADLWIYEVGKGRSISNGCNQEFFSLQLRPATNDTRLRLLQAGKSDPDGDGFFVYGGSLIVYSSGLTGADLDGWVPAQAQHALQFDAVRIIDDPNSDTGCGASPGADIDAVGAFTVPCTRFGQGGLDDDYVAGIESSSPSASLAAALELPALAYDQVPGLGSVPAEAQLAQTFAGLPTTIDAAVLMLDLRAGPGGGIPGAERDDRIRIGFADASGFTEQWSGRIGELNGEPGLARGPWTSGRREVMGLDLAALPLEGGGTLDLISGLESHGFVDVIVENNTGGDHLRLSYSPCPGSNLDAPGSSGTGRRPALTISPTPARYTTTIRYAVERLGRANLSIFDAAGRRVATLAEGVAEGAREVVWDLRDRRGQRVPAGFYIARLEIGDERSSASIVVVQ